MSRKKKTPTQSRGRQGTQGIPGPPGPAGPRGTQGATGESGATGLAGPRGSKGAEGAQGARGQRGVAGVSASVSAQPGLNEIARTIDDIYHELDIQLKRMAQIQQQLDELRTKVKTLTGSAN